MQKHERLIYIVNLLQNNQGLTARVISEKCDVSMRTVYRDILTLSESGIPVYFDKGYHLLSRAKMPGIALDDKELILLSLALKSSSMFAVEPMKKHLEGIISKLTINSHSSDFEASENVETMMAMSASTSAGRIKDDTLFENLEMAMMESSCIRLEYKDSTGKNSDRTVKPYSLVFRGRGFYLLAFCTVRNAYRLFHLERIVSYMVTDENFIPDDDFSVDQYFRYSWRVGGGTPQNIVIEFAPEAAEVVLSGKRHHTEKITRLKNGTIRYTIYASGLTEIARWLIGFGDSACVVKPKQLTDLVHSMAVGACNRYPDYDDLSVCKKMIKLKTMVEKQHRD